jgi:Kef-type K+ transport system membrane component KefB/nucleotide-binding universal stress UspA family protein
VNILPDLLPLSDPGAVFAVFFLIVLLGPLLAQRVGIPAIAGLILLGMLVGPNLLGILARDTFIETLGYVGLLYLMFQGGLDLDIEGFRNRRTDSVAFGLLTYAIPMVGVIVLAMAIGLDLIPAVIVGTALASHTLLAYPIVSRFQLATTRGVTATLGATLVGNVLAFLTLAVAVAAVRSSGWLVWARFAVGFAGYVAVVLVLVPRLTHRFFTGVGQDRQVRLTYLLSGMGVASLVAGLIGIEPIVGAFLIGLAFNRFVPARTVIAERIQVLGSSVFIPAFLISTGMLLDPLRFVTDPTTLLFGAMFLAATAATKVTAAEIAGRWMGVAVADRRIMFSLSVGQGAGALAAVLVASNLGLVGPTIVDAIILVILGSAIVAGAVAERSAPLIERPEGSQQPLGTRVVVPVSNPDTVGPLVRIAAQVAGPDSGAVVAINVLPLGAPAKDLMAHRTLTDTAERVALAAGTEVETSVRIDASPLAGVLHTLVERSGTCLVIGWKGYANPRSRLFGSVIDQVVESSPVPVLVCRPGPDLPTERVLVVLTEQNMDSAGDRAVKVAFEVASRLARHNAAKLLIVTDADPIRVRDAAPNFLRRQDVEVIGLDDVDDELENLLEAGDVIVTGVRPTSEGLGRDAQRLVSAVPLHTVIAVIPR